MRDQCHRTKDVFQAVTQRPSKTSYQAIADRAAMQGSSSELAALSTVTPMDLTSFANALLMGGIARHPSTMSYHADIKVNLDGVSRLRILVSKPRPARAVPNNQMPAGMGTTSGGLLT